jgi:hypothetical protein
VAFAALFLLLGSAAYAAADQVTTRAAPKKIYACVAGDHHTVNLTTAERTCPRGQHKISWNAAGRHGTRGPVGSTGRTGARGAAGTSGPVGGRGATGTSGADGAVGPAAPVGGRGATGTSGADGAVGPAGPKGANGDTGPQGADGANGPKGDTGAEGAQGPQGVTGSTGDAGRDGVSGAVWSSTLNMFEAVGSFGNGGTDVAKATIDLAQGATGFTITGTAAFKPATGEASTAGIVGCGFTADGIDIQTHGQAETYVAAGIPSSASVQLTAVGVVDEESLFVGQHDVKMNCYTTSNLLNWGGHFIVTYANKVDATPGGPGI